MVHKTGKLEGHNVTLEGREAIIEIDDTHLRDKFGLPGPKDVSGFQVHPHQSGLKVSLSGDNVTQVFGPMVEAAQSLGEDFVPSDLLSQEDSADRRREELLTILGAVRARITGESIDYITAGSTRIPHERSEQLKTWVFKGFNGRPEEISETDFFTEDEFIKLHGKQAEPKMPSPSEADLRDIPDEDLALFVKGQGLSRQSVLASKPMELIRSVPGFFEPERLIPAIHSILEDGYADEISRKDLHHVHVLSKRENPLAYLFHSHEFDGKKEDRNILQENPGEKPKSIVTPKTIIQANDLGYSDCDTIYFMVNPKGRYSLPNGTRVNFYTYQEEE
ncbi:MAG: hypothetical protein ABH851_00575 [Methanobacteriota archaeon]